MYNSLKILSFLQIVVHIVCIDRLSNNTLIKRTVTFSVQSLLHFFQTLINTSLSCHVYTAANSQATFFCAGRPLLDGAVDGRQPAEPRGEPALQMSLHQPSAAGPERL